MTEADKKSRELELLLEKVARQLSEHFDAVQIVASRTDGGLTYGTSRGAGNWYARRAMCQEFVEKDQAQTFAREMPAPPPDEGEAWKK